MTRKDFQLIAEVIKQINTEQPNGSFRVAELFADKLKNTNPNFDRLRFMTACGVIK